MERNCNQDSKYDSMNLVFHTCTTKTKTNLNSEINLAAHTSCNLGSFSTAWLPPMSCSKLFFHPWLALHYSSTYDWLYIILPPTTGSTLFFHPWLALHYSSTYNWLYIILPPMTGSTLFFHRWQLTSSTLFLHPWLTGCTLYLIYISCCTHHLRHAFADHPISRV